MTPLPKALPKSIRIPLEADSIKMRTILSIESTVNEILKFHKISLLNTYFCY